MQHHYPNKKLFDAVYSSNTQRARKEIAKSVFVASSASDIRVFNYFSSYEIADEASLIQCRNSELSQNDATEEATKQLTGLSSEDYSKKIDELFLQKRETYKKANMIWESYNFPVPDLNFSDLPNYASLDISLFEPSKMLERGLEYIRDASIVNFRTQGLKKTFLVLDEGIPAFLSTLDAKEETDDETHFLNYMHFILKIRKKYKEKELKPKTSQELYYRGANAIGVSESNLEEFILVWDILVVSEVLEKENFAQKILYSYWSFQKKLKEQRLKYKDSSILYYGKYSKDFINLYEDDFFRYSQESDDEIKYGVSIWVELNTQGSKTCSDCLSTQSSLNVVFAKSYTDGSSEIVATLYFDYTICFFKDEKSGEVYPSQNKEISSAIGNDIYHVVSQQFYPLYGISSMKGEGIRELMEQFTIDEGERGGILNLRDINISSKYSDRIIPELIKGVYDLVDYNSASSFPLFSCMVGGDIIVNDELFPIIKSPLLTLISSKYLIQRIHKIQDDKSKKNFNYIDFFSKYKENAHHYYNGMTLDPLRPILVY